MNTILLFVRQCLDNPKELKKKKKTLMKSIEIFNKIYKQVFFSSGVIQHHVVSFPSHTAVLQMIFISEFAWFRSITVSVCLCYLTERVILIGRNLLVKRIYQYFSNIFILPWELQNRKEQIFILFMPHHIVKYESHINLHITSEMPHKLHNHMEELTTELKYINKLKYYNYEYVF